MEVVSGMAKKEIGIEDLVTDVQLVKRDWDNVVGSGYIVLGGCIKVQVKIIKYSGGTFCSLPRQQSKQDEKKWFDLVMPCDGEGNLDKEVSEKLNSIVLESFESAEDAPPKDDKIPF